MNQLSVRTAFLLAALTLGRSVSAQPLTINCSDTLVSLSQKWADTYTAKHPDTKIQVTGSGTPAVFATFAAGKCNLVIAPRAMRYKEAQPCVVAFGQRPTEFKVGVNGVAVYVHPDNPVQVLNYDELFDIYKGKRRNWKQFGGRDATITAYGVETNTAAGELFAEEVLSSKGMTNDVHLVAGQELLPSIAHDPNAIGFGAFTPGEGVRALQIKRAFSSTPVEPSSEAIANRIYPISRFLYCYLNPKTNQGEIKSYLDWLRSDEGQQTAAQAGFYVLPPKWRAVK
jgi:phosphate transport system substrate-binding protein